MTVLKVAVLLSAFPDVCPCLSSSDVAVPTDLTCHPSSPLRRYLIGGVYTIQQTSSISTCILNTFAESLLDVCRIV